MGLPRRYFRAAFKALSICSLFACAKQESTSATFESEDAAAPSPPQKDQSLGSTGNGPIANSVDVGDPFAALAMSPSFGPWTGGTRAVLRGRGFPSGMRVWIGESELPRGDIFASDPTRAALVLPPSKPGPVAVRVRNEKTGVERVLANAFTYEAFAVEPNLGGTSGGTRVVLRGSETTWHAGAVVTFGTKACENVQVVSETQIECVTTSQAPGARDVLVKSSDGKEERARDAFTYSDSEDGYRGGISGGPLSGNLRVLAINSITGMPIGGAFAIVGSSLSSALVKRTDGAGLATFQDSALTGQVTVTVAAKCHQPTTFVHATANTVTAYLPPVMDPTCGAGDMGSFGNFNPRGVGTVTGELVWPGVEFKRGDWLNVPKPVRATERRVAYVFGPSESPSDPFSLPDASLAITEESGGNIGYAFHASAFAGNASVYALAGIEDRSVTPALFTAYAMGVARGVLVSPNASTTQVDIPIDIPLDHKLSMAVNTPASSARGPDRVNLQVAVGLGANAYAILPGTKQTLPLPVSGVVSFVGVPPLLAGLSSQSYVISAAAVSGSSSYPPASVIMGMRTTDTGGTLNVNGFIPVPVLKEPSTDIWSGTHVLFESNKKSDLAIMSITSGGGLVSWTVLAPGVEQEFELPDLRELPEKVGLVSGPLQTTLYLTKIDAFEYAKLRYGQLRPAAWTAYAVESRPSVY